MALGDRSHDQESRSDLQHHDTWVNDEKLDISIASTQAAGESITSSRPNSSQSPHNKMASLRYLLSAVVLLAFITFAIAAANPRRSLMKSCGDDRRFQELLATVPESSLHEVLHEYVEQKYQSGSYPGDRPALQAVHKQDPSMASSLVELARRQAGNQTIFTSSATTTSESASLETTSENSPITASSSTSLSPTVPAATSTPAGLTTTTSPSSTSTTFIVPTTTTPTTSSLPATTFRSSSTSSTTTVVSTTTSTTAVSSTSRSSFTSTTLRTTSTIPLTTASTSTSIPITPTTVSPTRSTTRAILLPSTMPDGAVVTVTSFVVVAAGDETSTVATAPSTPVLVPGLQTGAARPQYVGQRSGALVGLAGAILAAL